MSGDSAGARLVVVLSSFTEAWLAQLRAIEPGLRIEQYPMFAALDDVPLATWRDVEVLFTFRAFPTPEQAPRLRWIQLNSAGADAALAQHGYRNGDVQLTNLSGIHAIPIAEHVFTVLLASRRRVDRVLEWQAQAFWPRQDEARSVMDFDELYGQTLGIIGYGSIGRQVARIARAFGMRVLALQRGDAQRSDDHRDVGYVIPGHRRSEGKLPERFYAPHQLHELLAECDVIVVALPATPATDGIIDVAALRSMKRSAFLVNVGRGSAIDELGLRQALTEGWLAGAALDVARQEPLPGRSLAVAGPQCPGHAAPFGDQPALRGARLRAVRRKSSTLRARRAAPEPGGADARLLNRTVTGKSGVADAKHEMSVHLAIRLRSHATAKVGQRTDQRTDFGLVGAPVGAVQRRRRQIAAAPEGR